MKSPIWRVSANTRPILSQTCEASVFRSASVSSGKEAASWIRALFPRELIRPTRRQQQADQLAQISSGSSLAILAAMKKKIYSTRYRSLGGRLAQADRNEGRQSNARDRSWPQ